MAITTQNFTLQLKRNATTPYSSKVAAVQGLEGKLKAAQPGEPIIAVYTESGKTSILLGIAGNTPASQYQVFEGAAIGENGAIELPKEVEKAIDDAISGVTGNASSSADTLGKIEGIINAMDFTGATGGTVITQVTQEDGKVSATTANLTSTDKTVTVNGLDLKVNVDDTTIKVNGTTGALYVDPSATSVTGKDAIKVTDNNGKQVELVIAEANKVLTQTTGGLDTTLGLKFVKASENTADGANKGKAVVQLTGVGNAVLGEFDATDLVMDGVLDKVELEGGELTFTWNTESGKDATTIDLGEYIKPYSAGNGLNLTSETFSVKIKENDNYLTVDEDGVASKGIDEAIAAAVDALDATVGDATVADGKHVAVQVVEVDGKITAVTVNESDIASASGTSAAISSATTKIEAIEEALGMTGDTTTITPVDEQIDAKLGAITTSVTTSSTEGHITVGVAQKDGLITAVTVTESDIASATALTAETGARKAVTGVEGDEYVANTTATYISGAIDLNDADVKLDGAVKGNADAIDVIAQLLGYTGGTEDLPDTGNGGTITGNTVEDKIENAINDLIYTDSDATETKYVSEVNQEKGIIKVEHKDILAAAQTVGEIQNVSNALQLINGSLYLPTILDGGTY